MIVTTDLFGHQIFAVTNIFYAFIIELMVYFYKIVTTCFVGVCFSLKLSFLAYFL